MKYINRYRDPEIYYESEKVYAPSDDSYLIIDFIKKNLNNDYFNGTKLENINNILDMGTGTGIISIILLMMKEENPKFKAQMYASDISEEVLNCAKKNEKVNGFTSKINYIHSDLFKSFPNSLHNIFDIIFFNPPYLPLISNSEYKKNENDFCWDGGKGGIELFIRFLKDVKNFLNIDNKSCVYYISSSNADQRELNKIIKDKGFKSSIIEKKHIFFEDILLNKLVLV
ncbi:MAG: methyltransferase domain-containing protein [Candidatus Lokiarchaeota archaeon]|nr:methyltransferase domain-containing protein [Candidatus Lokiarchaeota archaeon]